MGKNKVLRSYAAKSDGQLGDFALHVATSLTGNGNFTNPPITPAFLTTEGNGFITSVAACLNGSPAQTLAKNTLREALIGSLDTLATYVDLTAANDAQKIVSAGFDLANTSARTPAAPGATAIVSITNTASGKLDLELQAADNAWCYIVEYTALPSGAVKTATFTSARDVTLTGLVPGTMYSIRAMVMGSANQVTDWSDAVQHMAT
jgi:hypothetical protein